MLTEVDIAELIRRLKEQSDQDAFKKLYRLFWRKLFGVAYSTLASKEEAKDFAQEVFVKLWENRHSLIPDRSISAYLFTILKNNLIDHARRQAMMREKLKGMQEDIDLHTPVVQLQERELEALIDHTVRNFPSRMQKIWLMSRREHMSIKDIASALNISEQTVKNQLSNSLRIIRTNLGK